MLKYATISGICIYMNQKCFSEYFLLNKSSTFFTFMELHTPKRNILKNQDSTYKTLRS